MSRLDGDNNPREVEDNECISWFGDDDPLYVKISFNSQHFKQLMKHNVKNTMEHCQTIRFTERVFQINNMKNEEIILKISFNYNERKQ